MIDEKDKKLIHEWFQTHADKLLQDVDPALLAEDLIDNLKSDP